MAYIKSSNIEVFPVAKKRSINAPGTRIFTEANVSNFTRQLLSESCPGYIISCAEEKTNHFNIAFNLYGYYFNITDLNLSSIGGMNVYASIKIVDGEIHGQDVVSGEAEYYHGLEISTNIPTASDVKYLKLFEKYDGAWKCSSQSFGLISALTIGGIDGKYK